MSKIVKGWHNVDLIVRLASHQAVRDAVQADLNRWEKYAGENRGKLNRKETDTLWALRSFVEVYDKVVVND